MREIEVEMKTVKVILEPKKKMRDKKGRHWLGMNKDAAKPNSFREIKTEEVLKSRPKRLRAQTERHEYVEQKEMDKGRKYKAAHKVALKKEKKPIPRVKFKEIKKT